MLFAFLHRDQVFLVGRAAQHANEIEQQDHGRGDAEDEAGGVEEQADRDAGRRRAVAEGQHRLLPAAQRQKPVGVEHQDIARDEADLLAERRQRADQGVDAEMGVLAQRDDGAEERQPHQQPARQLFRGRNPRVEEHSASRHW